MYRKKAHIHFVGIGGIGMSGIATILRYQGYTISGCDADIHQKSVYNLQKIGCIVYEGNNTVSCDNDSINILVYSSAIKNNNPELLRAQRKGIPTISRALMLAELMRTKYSIAIAGAHGKTTTTSLVSHILMEAKKDPTIIIGGHLKNISANARLGTGDFLVAEADESDRSLINLHASLAVITNIDLEHLETYKDIDDIKATFKQFLNNLPFYGAAVVCNDNAHIRSLFPMNHIRTITYGIDYPADIQAKDIHLEATYSEFMVTKKAIDLGAIHFTMLGKHNVLNALAAIGIALELDISFDVIQAALQSFKGIERRFSFKGAYKGADFFDDYGHHPEEIKNTLLIARKKAQERLIVVFQPHRFTRTAALWDSFIEMFLQSAIDSLIITDIYPASESPIPEITGSNLAKALLKRAPRFSVEYAPCDVNFKALCIAIEKNIQPDDLVLFLGAGKMNKLADFILEKSTIAQP